MTIKQEFAAADEAAAQARADAAAAYLGPDYQLTAVVAGADEGTWLAEFERTEADPGDGAVVGSAEERT